MTAKEKLHLKFGSETGFGAFGLGGPSGLVFGKSGISLPVPSPPSPAASHLVLAGDSTPSEASVSALTKKLLSGAAESAASVQNATKTSEDHTTEATTMESEGKQGEDTPLAEPTASKCSQAGLEIVKAAVPSGFRQPRKAKAAVQKRPLTGAVAREIDESDSSDSEPPREDFQDDVWLPTPAASGAGSGDGESSEAFSVSDVTDLTSSTSEGGPPTRVVALPLNTVEFASWEAFDEYLAAYEAQTFQLIYFEKKGVKKSGIISHLMKHTDSNPTPKDVQNLVQKLKAREQRDGPSSTDKRLKKWMKQFGDVPGNVGRVFLDDVGGKVE
ncbi:hypothetical protein PInf_004792 [Phytophthora infestans]|nr:hypothetical protein PInf_004792 [Phytophthora infestans]